MTLLLVGFPALSVGRCSSACLLIGTLWNGPSVDSMAGLWNMDELTIGEKR